MIAAPIALALFGYWVLYAGLKRVSLADAYSCRPQQQQTGTPQSPGGVTISGPRGPVTLAPTGDCPPRAGDTRLGGGFWWRPIGPGALGQLNGQLVGPC